MARTKIDIVGKVHEVGFTNKTAIDELKTLLEIIKQALDWEGDALISGFGKSGVEGNKPGRGRKPSTGTDRILWGERS
jgi:nucleoid DNA-binding protein